MSYLFIACTIFLTVYGHVFIKCQVGLHPAITADGLSAKSIVSLLLNP